jgi:hypothetical protein
MPVRLGEVLEESRPAIETALEEARLELAELDARRHDLEALIARAEAALGQVERGSSLRGAPRRTLHEAMELVLMESPNQTMSVQDLAQQINERRLYEKRDRSPVEPNQIHARASSPTYQDRFEKHDGVVRLRSQS